MEELLGAILGGVIGGLINAGVILLLLWGYNARRGTWFAKVLTILLVGFVAAVGYTLVTTATGKLGLLSSQIALATVVWAVQAKCRKAGWMV